MARSGTKRGRRRRAARPAGAPQPTGGRSADSPLWDRAALGVLAAYALAMLWTVVAWHPTPTYAVETDLLGEYIPAAQALLAGQPAAEHYQFRGFGYSLLLAGASRLTLGDFYLAALLLNVAAAAVGAWLSYALAREFLTKPVGLFVLLGLLANPVFLRATVEGGTDMPAFALSLAATFLVLRRESARALATAGLLAGLAFVTRYNALFLAVGAGVLMASRRARPGAFLAYGAGLALPVGAWMLTNHALTGDALANRNYLNVAYAVYGREVQWDIFWTDAARRFHSLADVVRQDPGAFARGIALNLGTHWMRDVTQLVPAWIGIIALPGMLSWWGRRPGWGGVLLHFGLSYLVLGSVFYTHRFFLYHLPFYLAGAGTLLVPAPAAGRDRLSRILSVVGRHPGRPWRPLLVGALLLASGAQAVAGVRGLLAGAPYETRRAGRVLHELGPAGGSVMARKPHVAYFAGMNLVRFPAEGSFFDLLASARAAGADYLFFSGIEAGLRPDLIFLVDPGVNLPGCRQVARDVTDSLRYYALYRITRESAGAAAMDSALEQVLRRSVVFHPGSAAVLVNAAEQLARGGRYREALDYLDQAERSRPDFSRVAALRAPILAELGRREEAREACERALRLGADRAWGSFFLGQLELEQGRYAHACRQFAAAVELQPANPEYLRALGLAEFFAGDFPGAAAHLERSLSTDPTFLPARLYAARALRATGRGDRALAVIEAGGEASRSDPWLAALADSLRAGAR